MKRLRRILVVVASVICAALLLLAGAFLLVRGTPGYYVPGALTREQIEIASQSAEQTLTRMQNLAAELQSRQLRGTSQSAVIETFTFSQDELNALFKKWAALNGWRSQLDPFVSEAMIVLQPGCVILAGRSKVGGVETVFSMQLQPHIDSEGRLTLNLARVSAGKLPLPRETLIGRVRDGMGDSLHHELSRAQQRAKIDSAGIANDDAMRACVAQLLLNALNERPEHAVLFIPSGGRGFVPMKVADVRVNDRAISFDLAPHTPSERDSLLKRIRQVPD